MPLRSPSLHLGNSSTATGRILAERPSPLQFFD